jgi:hypothetical protein
MLMEKRDTHLKLKMLLLKKKSQSTTVIFNYFQKNKWLFNLISFCNMPIIYMNYEQQGFNNPKFTWKAT